MTTYTIQVTHKPYDEQELRDITIDADGTTAPLGPTENFVTDDPEVAALAADSAARVWGAGRTWVETVYDDGEPAATSTHTGYREPRTPLDGLVPKTAEPKRAGSDRPKAAAKES